MRSTTPAKKGLAIALGIAICAFFAWFDSAGGFYNLPKSLGGIWVYIPTLEGAAFGAIISSYDRHPFRVESPVMKMVQKAGEYSYAIYLLHLFFISYFVYAVEKYVMALSDIYLCLPWAMLFHAFMTVLGSVSYRFIESPFLRYRKRYVVENERNVLTVSYLKAA